MKKKTLIGLLTLVMLSVLTAFCFTACTTRVQNVHLNFVVEGETISTIETSGKEVVSNTNNPEKEGYTLDRKSTRLKSSHMRPTRMPSSA